MVRVVAGVAALLIALCLATGALAHATLVSAEPADGSVLTQPPKTLQLRFSEGVTPTVVSLIDAAGKTRDDIKIDAVDQTVVVTLPDDLPRGTQIISYRVVSQDGHPVAGSLLFSIGVVTGGAAASGDRLVSSLIWLARLGVYLWLFVGRRRRVLCPWMGRARADRPSAAVRLPSVSSAVASLGLQASISQPSAGGIARRRRGRARPPPGPSLSIAIVVMAIAGTRGKAEHLIAWVLTTRDNGRRAFAGVAICDRPPQ